MRRRQPTDQRGPTEGRDKRLRVDSTSLEEGDILDGRYRVDGVLGRGGSGAVYSATHLGTEQPVALKMLLGGTKDDDEVRRFIREARITAKLRHPNTVRVFDVGETESGALYIAMERLHGQTLEQRLVDLRRAATAMSESEACVIAVSVLRSLGEAHRQGVVHRDLKPANIMLTEVEDERLIKVLDFGIARPQGSSLTGAGTSLGTPAYMSPEQCRGEVLDGRSDLYSLGIILFRCVTGHVPFDDRNPLTVMFKHASEALPDLRQRSRVPLSEGFERAVLRALSKDRERRFATAKEMRDALQAAVTGEPCPHATARYAVTPSSSAATTTPPAEAGPGDDGAGPTAPTPSPASGGGTFDGGDEHPPRPAARRPDTRSDLPAPPREPPEARPTPRTLPVIIAAALALAALGTWWWTGSKGGAPGTADEAAGAAGAGPTAPKAQRTPLPAAAPDVPTPADRGASAAADAEGGGDPAPEDAGSLPPAGAGARVDHEVGAPAPATATKTPAAAEPRPRVHKGSRAKTRRGHRRGGRPHKPKTTPKTGRFYID